MPLTRLSPTNENTPTCYICLVPTKRKSYELKSIFRHKKLMIFSGSHCDWYNRVNVNEKLLKWQKFYTIYQFEKQSMLRVKHQIAKYTDPLEWMDYAPHVFFFFLLLITMTDANLQKRYSSRTNGFSLAWSGNIIFTRFLALLLKMFVHMTC